MYNLKKKQSARTIFVPEMVVATGDKTTIYYRGGENGHFYLKQTAKKLGVILRPTTLRLLMLTSSPKDKIVATVHNDENECISHHRLK